MVAPKSSSLDVAAYGAHVPEDKDQALVRTPYGKGMVIRTRRQNNGKVVMREMELTDWKQAVGGGLKRPATLFSPLHFPSIEPSVGNDVVCVYGRGEVMELRDDSVIVVRLSSWRLAERSRVTCYLQRDAVQVVRGKKLYEMSVYEKVEHAQKLKDKASSQFSAKDYAGALETYARAVEAVRYVQHKTDSSNEVRADLLVVMVTCSNNAATCCSQLAHKEEQVSRFAKNALILIDALEEKRGKKIHTLLNREGFSDVKLFGQWRVKSYLLMARVLEKRDAEQAMNFLKKAHDVIVKYTAKEYAEQEDQKASVQQLMSINKEVMKLHAQCKERRRVEKRREKQRAQKMFASASSDDDHEEEKKELSDSSPTRSPEASPTSEIDPFQTEDSFKRMKSTETEERGADGRRKESLVKKRVSFSEHVNEKVYEPDIETGEEEANSAIANELALYGGFGVALGIVLTLMSLNYTRSRG